MSTQTETFVIDLPGPHKKRPAARKIAAKRGTSTKGTRKAPRGMRMYALKVGGERIRSQKRLKEVFLSERGSRRPTVFISSTATQLAPLADVAHQEAGNLRLFVWEGLKPERREYLQTLFRTVVSPGSELKLLPSDELAEALSSDTRGDRIVGGTVNRDEDVVVLYRGSFDRLSVPLAWFRRSSDVEPDFDEFSMADFGQTICFGDFEASSDAVLYDFDADYRSRMKQRQLTLDNTFGGSLRRLRDLKGMRRSDFAPLSSKEIARIERGEIKHPRDATLETIANRLGVTPEEIPTY